MDVAVVLDDFGNSIEESWRMDRVLSPLSSEHDLLLTAVPLREREWLQREYPLHRNVQTHGVAI